MLPKAVGQTVPQLFSHRRKQALKTGRQTFLAGTKTGTKFTKHFSTARLPEEKNKEEQRMFISGTAGPQKDQPTSTSYPNTRPLPLQLQWWLVNA